MTLKHPRKTRVLATVLGICLMATACGGSEGSSAPAEVGEPVQGGTLRYGIALDNTEGWCLPETTLATADAIVAARAIYDTLVVPDADGNMVGALAESFEPNDDYTEWTFRLRDGVVFHDGTEFNATVAKNNIDAWLGTYPGRTSFLGPIQLEPVSEVLAPDEDTLVIRTESPWPALPHTLYASGRVGMMAQAQLDDPDSCDRKLIGTGPFALSELLPGDSMSVVRNDDYWATDAEGRQLPYLDRVEFRIYSDEGTRVGALAADEVDALIAYNPTRISELASMEEAGSAVLNSIIEGAGPAYFALNPTKAPFDNRTAREAVVMAMDMEEFRTVILEGRGAIANGPFGSGQLGYLDDSGYPTHDLDRARELAAEYEDETGEPLSFTMTVLTGSMDNAQLIQQQLAEADITMKLKEVDLSALLTTTLGGQFEAITSWVLAGTDPDQQYLFWYGGMPTNQGRFDDPEINALLDEGRSSADPQRRQEIYEELNREFARELYSAWGWISESAIATSPQVQGVMGPANPDGSEPYLPLTDGHSVAGTWFAG